MPTFKTDVITRETAGNQAALPSGQSVSGEHMEVLGTYTTTGAEVSGDIIQLFAIPMGAFFRSLTISTNGVGGTTVVFSSIGDAGSASRYSSTSIALTAAGTDLPMVRTNAAAVTPFAVDTIANQTIQGVLGGTFPMTAGQKIVARGFYRMP